MADFKSLDEQFGQCCNYCKRYNAIEGVCGYDDEDRYPEDGDRCIIFEWDPIAIKMLEGGEIFGDKVPNIWNQWYAKAKVNI